MDNDPNYKLNKTESGDAMYPVLRAIWIFLVVACFAIYNFICLCHLQHRTNVVIIQQAQQQCNGDYSAGLAK
jgi:hypothetical protein